MKTYGVNPETLEKDGAPVLWPIEKARAVDRLLEWGFAPEAIAAMLGCSLGWIEAIRQIGNGAADDEDATVSGN